MLAIDALLRCGRTEEAGLAVQALRRIEFGVPEAATPTSSVEFVVSVEPTTTVIAAARPNAFDEDLAQAEFLAGCGHLEEARTALAGTLAAHPGHPAITARLAELTAMLTAAAETAPAGGAQEDLGLAVALLDEAEEIVSLHEDPAYAVEALVAQFRAGVARTVRPEDAATHYDLGLAFFQMELFQQALEEFETALAADPARRADCLTMVGRCRLGLAEPQEAIDALEQAIVQPDLPPDARGAAYGHLAAALEAVGRPKAAHLHLREALRLAPDLPGLKERMDALVAGMAPPKPVEPEVWELEPTPSAA